MKKLIVGNWKMSGSLNDARSLIRDVVNSIHLKQHVLESCDFVVCPPFVHLSAIRHPLQNNIDFIKIGAQDCAPWDNGPYTGDISAFLLKDSSCVYVLLGHSERRNYHKESDDLILKKMQQAIGVGLVPILCVGETEKQRHEGRQKDVVREQLAGCLPPEASCANVIIAYEPVWAIGTGKTATGEGIGEMHTAIADFMKERLAEPEKLRILYGGSVRPDNAAEIFAADHVNGVLVGGASLNAEDFLSIAVAADQTVKAARRQRAAG